MSALAALAAGIAGSVISKTLKKKKKVAKTKKKKKDGKSTKLANALFDTHTVSIKARAPTNSGIVSRTSIRSNSRIHREPFKATNIAVLTDSLGNVFFAYAGTVAVGPATTAQKNLDLTFGAGNDPVHLLVFG